MVDPPIHEVANLFPLINGEEFEALKQDIVTNGLREPVWLWQGKLIDGRNRLRACREVGIEPRFREWDGQGSLVAFVLSLNLIRRHLTTSQRAAIAAEVEPLLADEMKERQRQAGREHGRGKAPEKVVANLPQPNGRAPIARDEAGAKLNVAPRTVQTAKRVRRSAPALHEKVKAGEITLHQAAREVDREHRRQEMQGRAERAEAAAAGDPAGPPWRILHGDAVALLDAVETGSVETAFADPPYNQGVDYGEGAGADRRTDADYLGWCRAWLARCVEKLTTTGSLWLLISDEYAAELGCLLKRDLALTLRAWIKWYETFGVCNSSGRNFSRCSRHLFYAVKDPSRCTFNAAAVTRPSDRQTKYDDPRADPGGKVWDDVWQIPRLVGTARERLPDFPTQLPLALLRPIVLCASNPGDLVLDPFSGSATTGVAAVEAGRRYVGIEKQKRFVDLSTLRLKGVGREPR